MLNLKKRKIIGFKILYIQATSSTQSCFNGRLLSTLNKKPVDGVEFVSKGVMEKVGSLKKKKRHKG